MSILRPGNDSGEEMEQAGASKVNSLATSRTNGLRVLTVV